MSSYFDEKCDTFISEIEENIRFINTLSAQNKPIENFEKRLDFLLLACDTVQQAQQHYINYYNENNNINTRGIIEFDYDISNYANRLYRACNNMLVFYSDNISKRIVKAVEFSKIELLNEFISKMLCISARWHIERVLNIWDSGKAPEKQKLPRRQPLLKDVMPCFDNILATKMGIDRNFPMHIKRLIVCLPPSSGKTYCANVYTILMLAHHMIRFKETGIIRMTNTADNARAFGQQVYSMMTDPMFVNVFPELRKYCSFTANGDVSDVDIFKYASQEKMLLKDCAAECAESVFMFGADAQVNGKRSMLGAVIDDMSGGQQDMDNDELHKKLTDKVMSDIIDRSDDEDCPIIVMGTMYNENDVQNSFINRWQNTVGLEQVKGYKFVSATPDGTCVTCLVDIENEYGESIAPKLYSTNYLIEKREYFRNRGKEYVYDLMYRQKRASREPKTFDYSTLFTYNKLPKGLNQESIAMLDNTRTNGNDFFALPFCKYNPDDKKYYLVDCIFEQKSLGLVSDKHGKFKKKVCRMIAQMNCIECCVENNTSNTTTLVLKEGCEEIGYRACKFRERTTSRSGKVSSKVVRILNMEDAIKDNICFPSKKANVSPQLRLFMQYFTNWNSKQGQKKSNPDDSVDSIAMLTEEFIYKQKTMATVNFGFSKSELFGL